MSAKSTPLLLRLVLLSLALESAVIAVHALFFPRYFYEQFLLGRGWVMMLPPYNEHITRDLGALYLGFFVVLAFAAWKLTRDLVNAANLGFVVATTPHMIFHALHTHDAPILLDKILQVGLLAATVALGGVVWALARRHFADVPGGPAPATSGARNREPVR